MTRRPFSPSPIVFLPLLLVALLFSAVLRHPFLALLALFFVGRAVARRARRDRRREWDVPVSRRERMRQSPVVHRETPRRETSPAQRAYLAARDAVQGSPSLDEQDRAQMLATLKEGLTAARRMETARARLDGAPDDRIDGVAEAADAKAERFIADCETLRRSLAALEIQSQDAPALSALAAAADDLAGRVQAHREIAAL